MASDQRPPLFSDVAAFSFGNELNQERYRNLIASFQQRFSCPPQFLVRAPGRVNIIGEHVDYSGYGVLPMAIAQDLAMAFCVGEGEDVQLVHQSPSYQPQSVVYTCHPASTPITGHHWYEYALCGVKGITEKGYNSRRGIKAMMCGNVPPSAGLSSSSALVCCAALMTNVAYAGSLSKQEIATLCAECERYIGTQGGGMDQAISFLAQPGTAKYIQFNPLRTTDVPLPKGAAFVVANSLVKADKAATPSKFNERVVECRLGAKVIAKLKQLDWEACCTLGKLQEALGVDLPAMLQVVEECLHPQEYSREEVRSLLDMNEEQLQKTCLSANTLHMKQFHLYKRAKHVYSEALRVVEFQRIAMEAAQSGKTPEQVLTELGQLMNDSHASCRDLYQCSHPDLDRLVEICTAQPGAYGARLTGAGWGGCMVALVAEETADRFVEAVKGSGFYEGQQAVDSSVIFATQPGAGAAILKM